MNDSTTDASTPAVLRGPGRPTTFTEELGHQIAALYAKGLPWRAIEARTGMPDWRTIRRWRDAHPEFAHALACAREAAGSMAAWKAGRVLRVDTEKGDPRTVSARVTLAGTTSNYYRWLAGCLDRETYGDRTQVDAKVAVAVVAFMSAAAAPEETVVDVDVEEKPPPQPSAFESDTKRA